MKKQIKTNYWEMLNKMGFRYGVEIVKSIESNNGSDQTAVFEFQGKLFRSGEEIYKSVTK